MTLPGLSGEAAPQGVDFYPTPLPVVMGFLKVFLPRETWMPHPGLVNNHFSILDPGAGSGNICRALRMHGYTGDLTAVEIRDEETTALSNLPNPTPKIIIQDFLKWTPDRRYDLAIGNPPFSLAKEFALKCFECADRTALLLRLGFLATERRRKFWEAHPVDKLYVVVNRPSFVNGGNDSQEYAWFVWDGSGRQEMRWI